MTAHNMNRYWGGVDPVPKAEFFNLLTTPAADGDGTVATIRMHGPIDSWGGWWGVSASDVSEIIDALPDTVQSIILRINSPGGEVFEAMTILNMLRAHRATVTAVVDGLAASAASVIAAACDETVMSPGSVMMIHSPLTWTYGNAEEIRKTADILDRIEGSIIEIYEGKAGPSDWGKLLADETWLTAADAVTLGLADRVAVIPDAGTTATAGAPEPDTVPDIEPAEGDDIEDRSRLVAAYKIGALGAWRASSHKPPTSTEAGNPNQKEAVVSDALKAGLSARLGVTEAEITDEALLAAVDEVLAEQAPTPAAIAASIPAGAQLIDSNVLDSLRADAAAGRAAREEQNANRRDAVIADALRQGRISTANVPALRAMLDADETSATTLIQSFAPNTVPVAETGYAADDVSEEDALMAQAGWTTTEEIR